ncbi:RNA-binding protein 38-like isoform X1 [Brassica rapa]|uniref:(rape) hypothetical protein n=2 Tax=Brassica napus TaxID=3708 RepID=A0A816TZK1_BRANA|nr:RNA-binding protein 38-like isoform X1 [Brassica rapa]KAH0927744.1 hypothetical protein HID58_020000 [Brassica napus]CAF2102817.1 unnamed protein product [Brassica napus]
MSQPNNNNGDDDKRYKKIFVGGLAWSVTTDVLRSFFQENCGEVLEANVVSETLPDGNLKSKGYGFVTFRDVAAATRACRPPYPDIEGRRTNINLAYVNAKNNPNQTGLLQQAGPSHQYQHGPFNQMAWHQYQNGWFNQVAWQQYPQFCTNPQFPQVYWDSYRGAYFQIPHHPCSSNMNWHQTHSLRPPGMSQPPTEPRFEELPADTNQEAVSTPDVVRNDNNEEVDTETDSGVDQQNGKDQDGEISGQDNSIKLDVKDQEGEINGQNNGIKQDVKDQEGEINGQDNGIKQDVKNEEGNIVSGEDENTKQGAGVTNQFCSAINVTLQIETGREEKSENTPQENGFDHEEKTQHRKLD